MSTHPCTIIPTSVTPADPLPIRAVSGDSLPSRKAVSRLKAIFSQGGLYYSLLYATRYLTQSLLNWLDRSLVRIEQRNTLTEPWTISARRFTASENKQLWNQYDWSQHGEEWTKSAEWKEKIVRDWLIPYLPDGGRLLEIGPGGGRWTEILQRRAARLSVVDVAELPIALCQKRFRDCENIAYFVGDGRSIPVPDLSIDGIWSYDVFVHITPLDVRQYFFEFARILRPGGYAVIHHAGAPVHDHSRRPGWRSDLTDKMVSRFAQEAGLRISAQTDRLVNAGDLLTVLHKPASNSATESIPHAH